MVSGAEEVLVMCGWVVEWKGKAFFSVMLVNLVHAAESESALETRDHRNQSPVWTSEAVLLCQKEREEELEMAPCLVPPVSGVKKEHPPKIASHHYGNSQTLACPTTHNHSL